MSHLSLSSASMMLHKLMHNPAMTWLRKSCNQDCAKVVLRLAVGLVFINHGWMKLQGLEMTAGFFAKLGIPMPGLMAPFIACVEFFGGIALILGLGTRLVAFLQGSTMVVAVATVFGLKAISGAELELMLLAASISLLLSGAGAYSLDAKMMKKGEGEHDAALPMARP